MRVYLPSDRFQTGCLFEKLVDDGTCAYIRVGRNPVEDVYSEENCPFEMDKATILGDDSAEVVLVACGEMVRPSVDAMELLKKEGFGVKVIDMYCVKPLDRQAVTDAAKDAKLIVTVEEHSPFGGLGSMVAQAVSAECPRKVINLALPDTPVITGTSKEVFAHYGLNGEGIAKTVRKGLNSTHRNR